MRVHLLILAALTCGCASSAGSISAPDPIDTVPSVWTGVTFRVVDAMDEADEGVLVSFDLGESGATGAELQAGSATTDAFGLATTMVRAPTPGTVIVTADADGLEPATAIVTVSAPVAGATIYSTCSGSADCSPGEACVPVGTGETSGALCTISCTTAPECPADSRCVVVADSAFCLRSCTTDGECPEMTRCVDVLEDDGTSSQLCAPTSFGG